jgi:DNA-binding transcriptional ArsR family regulator
MSSRADRARALAATAPIFAALGDETRIRLVASLCANGPMSIAALTEGTDVTRQAITKHLQVLEGAGLVRSVRKGRESRWTIEPRSLAEARRALDRIEEQWSDALARLARHLEEEP